MKTFVCKTIVGIFYSPENNPKAEKPVASVHIARTIIEF